MHNPYYTLDAIRWIQLLFNIIMCYFYINHIVYQFTLSLQVTSNLLTLKCQNLTFTEVKYDSPWAAWLAAGCCCGLCGGNGSL